jgi:hypothetical protein
MYYRNCRRSRLRTSIEKYFVKSLYNSLFMNDTPFISQKPFDNQYLIIHTARFVSGRRRKKSSHNRSYYASSSIKCKDSSSSGGKKKITFANIKNVSLLIFYVLIKFFFSTNKLYIRCDGGRFSSSTFSHISSSHIVVLWSSSLPLSEKRRKNFLLNMRLDFRQHERHIFQYVKWPDHFEEFSDHFTFFLALYNRTLEALFANFLITHRHLSISTASFLQFLKQNGVFRKNV